MCINQHFVMNKNYLTPGWSIPDVKAYSTTRLGGHSPAPFDSLNLGMHVGDQETRVTANRNQLAQDLQLPAPPAWLNQVHGCDVAVLEKLPHEIISADAAVTRQKNLVCLIMTADCLPILLCDQAGTQVAAIHAGWRSLASGIIFETLKKMAYDQNNEIFAWLGPAIGPNAFEIDENVKTALSGLLSSKDSQDCFKPLKSDTLTDEKKYFANLYQIATHHLTACGVRKISGGEYCTYSQPDLFFSYRRTSKTIQNGNPVLTGRMGSLIWLTQNQ